MIKKILSQILVGEIENYTGYLSSYGNISVDSYTEIYVDFLTWNVSPLVNFIGAIFQFCIFALVLSLKLNKRVYNYIMLKSLMCTILLANLLFTGNAACLHCKSNYYNTKLRLIHKRIIINVGSNSLINMVVATELLITFDRLCLLINNKNWLTKLKQKYIAIVIILFSIILYAPETLVYRYVQVTDQVFKSERIEFFYTIYYKIYYQSLNIFKIVFLIVYWILIILLVINYRKFIEKKSRLMNKRFSKKAENENNITKMIIIVGIGYFFATVLLVTAQLIGLRQQLDSTYNAELIIIRTVSYILSSVCLSINALTVLYYDNNIKNKVRQIFGFSNA